MGHKALLAYSTKPSVKSIINEKIFKYSNY